MITIDSIRPYLESGYFLNITKSNNNYYGMLVLTKNPLSLKDYLYVDVSAMLKYLPEISDKLGEYKTICRVIYDRDKNKIITAIKKEKSDEPYYENPYYSTVDDLELETNDIISGLLDLELKVESKNNKNNKKEKVKVKHEY